MNGFTPTDQSARARARLHTVLKRKWHLERVLGVGGMATVYAASHRTGHTVAVKMLHGELVGFPEVRARFAQEPYVANRVKHEGVVRVIDDDVDDDGSPFIVMELLEGQPLDEVCRQRGGRLPPGDALEIIDRILDVLAAAHAAGILHRDVKPQNVFVTREGAIKLIDFGVARAHQESGTLTRVGGILGTPAFMPPEQAGGMTQLLDERSDIWAVGATLFTMLSGRYVHEAGSALEFLAAALKPARSIAELEPHLDASVVALVMRALAHDRSERWPSAHSMQTAARRARASVSQQPTSPPLRPDAGQTAVLVGPGGTLVLRGSIPDWFHVTPGTIALGPSPEAVRKPRPDVEAQLPDEDVSALAAAPSPTESEAPIRDCWYVSNGAHDVGPVTLGLVRRGVEAGKVPVGSLVRHESWDEWKVLSEVLPGIVPKVLPERPAPSPPSGRIPPPPRRAASRPRHDRVRAALIGGPVLLIAALLTWWRVERGSADTSAAIGSQVPIQSASAPPAPRATVAAAEASTRPAPTPPATPGSVAPIASGSGGRASPKSPPLPLHHRDPDDQSNPYVRRGPGSSVPSPYAPKPMNHSDPGF